MPLGGLVALLVYLLVRYGHSEAYLGLIPSGGSLDRLGDLVRAGRLDIERYAAPIGVTAGVELLTVAGVGLVALAVDTLAVTLRRAALAGLPLLVLQTVPTAVAPDGVSWVAFTIGGAGFLALLLAESRERVSRWGRPMRYTAERANYRPDVETAPLGPGRPAGRRDGARSGARRACRCCPSVDASGWGFGSGGFGPGGDGGPAGRRWPTRSSTSASNLRRDDAQVLLPYQGKRTYLRMVADDEFTGDVWRPSELKVSRDDNNVEDGLRTPPGLGGQVEATTRTWRIQVGSLQQEWLPLPYPARRVSDRRDLALRHRHLQRLRRERVHPEPLLRGPGLRRHPDGGGAAGRRRHALPDLVAALPRDAEQPAGTGGAGGASRHRRPHQRLRPGAGDPGLAALRRVRLLDRGRPDGR